MQVLSKKLASMVELCDGLLSSQPHYEFGLRLICLSCFVSIALRQLSVRLDFLQIEFEKW